MAILFEGQSRTIGCAATSGFLFDHELLHVGESRSLKSLIGPAYQTIEIGGDDPTRTFDIRLLQPVIKRGGSKRVRARLQAKSDGACDLARVRGNNHQTLPNKNNWTTECGKRLKLRCAPHHTNSRIGKSRGELIRRSDVRQNDRSLGTHIFWKSEYDLRAKIAARDGDALDDLVDGHSADQCPAVLPPPIREHRVLGDALFEESIRLSNSLRNIRQRTEKDRTLRDQRDQIRCMPHFNRADAVRDVFAETEQGQVFADITAPRNFVTRGNRSHSWIR